MIKGLIKSYDFHFGDNFSDFLQSVDRASVTYMVSPVQVDGKTDETPDVRFNLAPTLSKYVTTLSNKFSKSCNEIERIIDDEYIKANKLNIMSRFIIEIEALQRLLSNSTTNGYSHKRFSF